MDEVQRCRTDRLLFDHCLQHGRSAYAIESPAPVLLPGALAGRIESAALTIWQALRRNWGGWYLPPFPERERIGPGRTPPFWARFDAFRSADSFFLAEVNVDRPGGHREALSDPATGAEFRTRFLGALRDYVGRYLGRTEGVRAALLIDPAHREELHIAHMYAGLVRSLGWTCTVVGPLNLSVAGEQALAFGEPIDLLIRQFPTEFGHEVPAWSELHTLHQNGHILMLNEPGALFGQSKSSFCWLWEMVLSGGGALTAAETKVVRETIPFTTMMTTPELPVDPADPFGPRRPALLVLLDRPGDWVLKPVLGRYSMGVTLGAIAHPVQWGAVVAAALAEPHYWIAQRYIPVLTQPISYWSADGPAELNGYVNWGLHILCDQPAGLIARCSAGPVTDDAWWAPVQISAPSKERVGCE